MVDCKQLILCLRLTILLQTPDLIHDVTFFRDAGSSSNLFQPPPKLQQRRIEDSARMSGHRGSHDQRLPTTSWQGHQEPAPSEGRVEQMRKLDGLVRMHLWAYLISVFQFYQFIISYEKRA